MPRSTKETEKNKKTESNNVVAKKSTAKKKTTSSKKETSKTKSENKKTTSKNDKVKKINNNKSSTSTTSKTKSTKKVTSTKKKTSTSKSKRATSTTAKASKTTKSSTVAKKTAPSKTKVTKQTKKESVYVLEYYDLPYRYNQTVVKLLAQTPTTLFVYWDISDDDRNFYISKYGENFFETTKPVLVIHNETMNYTYEIEINDFANCWYLHVNDPNCKYSMELGRRPKDNNFATYIHITYSNNMDTPNNHILFNSLNKDGLVKYRNVKNNKTFNKSIASFIPNMSKIYNLHDLYKLLYKDGLESIENSDINNPSSGSISSFK